MNIREYIASGAVEAYCLGILPESEARELTALALQYPELQAEIDQTLHTIELSLRVHPPAQSPQLRAGVLGLLEQLQQEQAIDLGNPPLITRHSDIRLWNEALRGIEPDVDMEQVKLHYLRDTEDYQLMVAWVNTEMMEDPHHNDEFQESFLILEGCCECDLGGQIVRLQAGDYLDIPFEVTHTFKNISPAPLTHVKALIQRRKVA